MLDEESAAFIEMMNTYMGTQHRIDPYNLASGADLKNALKMAVAEYRDYQHYGSVLYKLIEDFDESLEHFDTATWVNMGRMPEKTDELAMVCAESLSIASENFREIVKRAEERLSLILKVAVTSPDAVQKEVFGNAYTISPDEIDERLEYLYEVMLEITYHHSIPENIEAFLEVLNEVWSQPNQGDIER